MGCSIVGLGGRELRGTDGDDVICGSARAEHILPGLGNDTVYTGGGQDILTMLDASGTVHSHPDPFLLEVTSEVEILGSPSGIESRDSATHVIARDDAAQLVDGLATAMPLNNDSFPSDPDLSTFEVTALGFGLILDDISTEQSSVVVTVSSAGENGLQVIGYRICDISGFCDSAEILIDTDEMPHPIPPQLGDDELTLLAGTSSMVDVLENDDDPDGDLDPSSLSIVSVSSGLEVSLVDVDGGTVLEVAADETLVGDVSVVYEVCDFAGNCEQAALVVTVLAISDCTIVGTDGPDVLEGTSGNDVICGFRGNDVITGQGGSDLIFGGAGADYLLGGAGDDHLLGGRGADTIDGGGGSDVIYGGRGADTIDGGPGADEIHGGRGADTIDGGPGADEIHGGRAIDHIRGNGGDDLLFGGRGADDLRGGAGNDELFGRRGNDLIRGGAGTDIGRGGRGYDTCDGTTEVERSCA